MEKNTPKSYHSTAEKSKITHNTPTSFEHDFEVQKQYVQKLRTQRIKAEKLYHQYTLINKDREKLRTEKLNLKEEIERISTKYKTKMQQTLFENRMLTTRINQLQKQNEKLRMQKQQHIQLKLSLDVKIRELQIRLTHQQESKSGTQYIIESLEAEIQYLKSQNSKINEIKQLQVSNLQQQCQKLQRNYQKVLNENITEKQIFERQKIGWAEQKIKNQNIFMQKNNSFQSYKQKVQSELKEKIRSYEVLFADFQENKNFWKSKLEDKNKQINNLRRCLEANKEECKKLRKESEEKIFLFKEKEIQEHNLQILLKEISKRCLKAEQQLKENYQTQKKQQEMIKKLQKKIDEKQEQLKDIKRKLQMMSENCEEYLRIIKMKEELQEERNEIFETEFEQIKKMEKSLSKFE